jgi:mRNA interferase MazF
VVTGTAAPDRGDLVWISLDSQAGHEQAGRRPAMVLSPKSYNDKTGLALCCPVTSRVKGYPFEVVLPDDVAIGGVVLADQVKSLDWRSRRAEIAAAAPQPVVEEVLARLGALVT